MRLLKNAVEKNKRLRVLGIDDAPFQARTKGKVNIVGVVCSDTRFEGMLWNEADIDGADATQVIVEMIKNSKFEDQLHLVLFDGIAVGGFNIIDINHVYDVLGLPCIAVMRKEPDLEAIDNALKKFDDYERRAALIKKAGKILVGENFVFQLAGFDEDSFEIAVKILNRLTDQGKVPEALRLAHLIGSAVKTGESSKRA